MEENEPRGSGAKQMIIMLLVVGIIFGGIFAYKQFGNYMMKQYFAANKNPEVTISSMKAAKSVWMPEMKAVGSLRATLGVNVTAQLGGMIQTIYFTPGMIVKAGTPLVQQNADPNIAQLHSLQANEALAKITYDRDQKQYLAKGVSKQQLDSDLQNWKSLTAQVAQQKAIVDQLTINAPFTGRLGISKVNPGQYLNPGDSVVTLQSLDPIYVDFFLPQQRLSQLEVGQEVRVTIDAYPGKIFKGKITTISPIVEKNTRNIEVEATLPNPNNELLPGMFARTEVTVQKPESFITLPQSAITFNPYGDIVFLIHDAGKDTKGGQRLTVNQVFVTTGERRGDQIAILKGIKEGDWVVTSGQLKLKNGSRVVINNSVVPSDSSHPKVTNEHTG